MRILIIPDVHLKPELFIAADKILQSGKAENVICLMDIADNWNSPVPLYEDTYETAIDFGFKYPKSLWCWGNHDLSYVWQEMESGYNFHAEQIVREKLALLEYHFEDRLKYIHRIDNCLFMHGGLTENFVQRYCDIDKSVDEVIADINSFRKDIMWRESSPIWFRPQMWAGELYKADELTQVVGHTPVSEPQKIDNVISTDVFSTHKDGKNIGNCQFAVVDTETGEIAEKLNLLDFWGK